MIGHTFKERVSFACPHCGIRAAVVDTPNGVEKMAVIHKTPACRVFLDTDPLEYLDGVFDADDAILHELRAELNKSVN